MLLEVNRLNMLEAAKNAARVAPTNSPVDVLNGILVEGNDDTGEIFLTATNYDVSIQQKVAASVDESGAVLINSRLLVGMLSLLPGEFITISTTTPEVITVTGGKSVYTINCIPAKHYPKPAMPFPEETVKLKGLCSLARRTVFAVSRDENKPVLQCVSVKLRNNDVHGLACDGTRMMLVKDTSGSPAVVLPSAKPALKTTMNRRGFQDAPPDFSPVHGEREFLLPGRSLQMLASISTDEDVFEIGDVGNEVTFTRNDMLFVMHKLSGEYIDTTAILKSITPVYVATAVAGKIKEALGLLVIGVEKEPLHLAFADGNITLRRSSDYSEAQSAVTATVSKETPETGFCYSIENLYKLFQVVEGRVRLEIDAKGVMLVKTRKEVYMELPRQMPVRKEAKADMVA